MKQVLTFIFLLLSNQVIASNAAVVKSAAAGKNTPIEATIVELKDSTGLVYVGAEVNSTALQPYLKQLSTLLGAQQFQLFRANQLKRDQHGFHVTLINPYEYKEISTSVEFGQLIKLTLLGLGKVEINDVNSSQNAQSFFVITQSADGQKYRHTYSLKPKDFHITLGFNPHDIYSLSKGMERLVK